MGYSRTSIGIGVAALAAGPLFVTLTGAASLYLMLPSVITLPLETVTGFAIIALLAAPLGFFLALPLVALGSGVMGMISDRIGLARLPLAWAGVGALTGFGLSRVLPFLDSTPGAAFSLVATSAICGRICCARRAFRQD